MLFAIASPRASSVRRIHQCVLAAVLAAGCTSALPRGSAATDLYLMNDNHTDYGWNATIETVEETMATELDYYLQTIEESAGLPAELQPKYAADSWWYLYNYQQKRSATQFTRLLDATRAGNITFPLNPLVELYGAMTTEGAIRAGYWPGRMQRLYQIPFKRAQAMENAALPWGLSSIWRNSGAEFTWHGICGCATDAPFADHQTPLFRWRGPDDRDMLVKWYPFSGLARSLGGYAEARNNSTVSTLNSLLGRTDLAPAGVPLIGVFGYGWDDVGSLTQKPYTAAQNWTAQHPNSSHRVVVSNGVDFFEALGSYTDQLPVLKGGWGLDWELAAAALTTPTADLRNSVERLRTTELLAALAAPYSPGLWASLQPQLEAGLLDHAKYFEHTWITTAAVPIQMVIDNKRQWAATLPTAISNVEAAAAPVVASLFTTPDESRFAVFNPLGFNRTDIADLPVSSSANRIVTDVSTGAEMPSQRLTRDGQYFVRILARDVPSAGYRVYRVRSGTPTAYTQPAATGSAGLSASSLENDAFRVTTDAAGSITSLLDKKTGRELAGDGLNSLAGGQVTQATIVDQGPVSTTLNLVIGGTPPRQVALTLLREVPRLEIEDRIVDFSVPTDGLYHYRFAFNMAAPQIRFEELGAIASPGMAGDGGNYLPGSRNQYMALNHFVSVVDGKYAATLSNRDSFAMRIGNSSVNTFDLPSADLNVFAVGNPGTPGITVTTIRRQAGDRDFRHRFAIFTQSGTYAAADAMQGSLAHQNPLYALALPRNNSGPWTEPAASFLALDKPNVVLLAFKPAEEEGRGLVARVWEMGGKSTSFGLNVGRLAPQRAYRMTLIENDVEPQTITNGTIGGWVGANMMRTYRFLPEATN